MAALNGPAPPHPTGSAAAPVAIDLFAGAGGIAEGMESVGIRTAAAVELHPQPSLTYAFNHPNAVVLAGDIRDLSLDLLAARLQDRIGDAGVDVVVGGPPCQGFSTAGKKNATDPRNDLFKEFARVVARFLPRMFVLENVPGFKKMYGGRAFNLASELFRELGYEMMDTILDAADYGAPQRRLRFVMVGWLPGSVRPFAWPESTHTDQAQSSLFPDLEPARRPVVTVADAVSDLAFLEPGWESHRHQRPPASDFQRERRNGCNLVFNHLATRHRRRALEMFAYIPEGGTISRVPQELRSGKRTMARLHRGRISNAVLALPDDLIHYEHDRILSVREMARLQTFDDDFLFIGKRTSGFVERRVDVPQYTQVGNAVPPVLGRALGRALLGSLGGEVRDLRDLEGRRRRHHWVRGSSGFAGYTLDPAAEGNICLENVYGERMPLPVSTEDLPVVEAEAVREWVALPNPKRGQWAPIIGQASLSTGGE